MLAILIMMLLGNDKSGNNEDNRDVMSFQLS